MAYCVIPRTGDTPLCFEGEPIASETSRGPLGREATRWNEIEAYRTEDGEYVLHVGWRTEWLGEPARDAALILSSLEDGQALVHAALPPMDPLAGYPRTSFLDERRAALEREAATRFDAAVSAVLRKIRDSERVSAPRASRAAPLDSTSLSWGF